ncbi:hypothetical protein HDU96_005971 [Phlyctochytrium bullatum]|nr:hypothetical protein HDU96_005971 [Phlyctochytrium bullatum]
MKSALVLIGLAAAVAGQGAYNCPSSCRVENNCFCASRSIPGGLSPDQTPMFITLTLDDAIQQQTYEAFMSIQNAFRNPNGCPLPATYFQCNLYTDYWWGQRTYAAGNEIAGHTVSHLDLANLSSTNERRVLAEIYSNWDAINVLSGVPASELVGFRHPFLAYNKKTYDIIYQLKDYIKYESSIALNPIDQGYWPHTLDYGMPYNPPNCVGTCEEGSRWIYPGLWVIPMYTLMTNTTPPALWASMDITIDPSKPTTYEEALGNLRASFLLHYEKRLPFGLYQHVAQYIAWPKDVQERKTQVMLDFIRWTQTFPNVWYVTNQQLLRWMANPRPADSVAAMFNCGDNEPFREEVCDGYDNNRNNQTDEGLVMSCPYGNTTFQTCFGCPAEFPAAGTPVRNLSGNRRQVPDTGCPPGSGPWDPLHETHSDRDGYRHRAIIHRSSHRERRTDDCETLWQCWNECAINHVKVVR